MIPRVEYRGPCCSFRPVPSVAGMAIDGHRWPSAGRNRVVRCDAGRRRAVPGGTVRFEGRPMSTGRGTDGSCSRWRSLRRSSTTTRSAMRSNALAISRSRSTTRSRVREPASYPRDPVGVGEARLDACVAADAGCRPGAVVTTSGQQLIVEGVELREEADALPGLGMPFAQVDRFGRPQRHRGTRSRDRG